MRKKSTSSLRGSVELALSKTDELLKNTQLSPEIMEQVKIGIFEPLKRAYNKLPQLLSERRAKSEDSES